MALRWLHISDVHECKREGYHRTAMHDEIIATVKAADKKPDFVFFTGDLAFSGSREEYACLLDRFLSPLRDALSPDCPIFTVPGNHDVNREESTAPRGWMKVSEGDRSLFQEISAKGARKRTQLILPRFEEYRNTEKELKAWGEDWLAGETGSICRVRDVNGKKIAIVGINTAWLCHDDKDWGHLTAGKDMVDAALTEAKQADPDLVIVLGHHPLEAMTGEEVWSDGNRIRSRLEQANAIYLHGHLHKSGGQQSGFSMQNALAIQAPSGFQAGDSDRWRNGIMWGEVDFDGARLIVEPLKWNNDHREFTFDTDAAPSRFRVEGRDAFAYPLPGKTAVETSAPEPPPPDADTEAGPAEGWRIIDAATLAQMTETRPSAAEMTDWFNGSFPRWEVAAAHGVQPRKAVDDLVRKYRGAHSGAPRPVVRLLTGGGGEGKSAALLQVAAGLLRDETQNWSCFWRQASAAPLPANWPDLLPRKVGHAWLILVDDAESIGKELAETLKKLGARTDVHVLLAAREADWMLSGITDPIWNAISDFGRVLMAGLDAEDAQRIAETWAAWGDEAMGKLRGQTPETAAKALLGHAQEFAAKKEQGALLGALLKTREGEDYRDRVRRLMEPLREAPGIGSHKLLDIYAMIAAMHAENQLYLSRAVLAYALGCDEQDLDRGPLRTLRQEAMLDGGASYVLTRHRLIAEVARDWLVESGYDVERVYPALAVAAVSEFKDRYSRNPDISKWQFGLSKHFVDQGPVRWPVARSIAQALFVAFPEDFLYLTNFGGVLRRTERPGEALKVFSEHAKWFPGRRDVLYEWSVAAGEAGDPGLNVWLAARSVADDRGKPIDPKQAKLSLAGLGRAFETLRMPEAQAACGRLGNEMPEQNEKDIAFFERHIKAAPAPKARTLETDLEILRKAALQASYEAEPDHSAGLDAQIGEPDSYRFTMLAALLNGKEVKPR